MERVNKNDKRSIPNESCETELNRYAQLYGMHGEMFRMEQIMVFNSAIPLNCTYSVAANVVQWAMLMRSNVSTPVCNRDRTRVVAQRGGDSEYQTKIAYEPRYSVVRFCKVQLMKIIDKLQLSAWAKPITTGERVGQTNATANSSPMH